MIPRNPSISDSDDGIAEQFLECGPYARPECLLRPGVGLLFKRQGSEQIKPQDKKFCHRSKNHSPQNVRRVERDSDTDSRNQDLLCSDREHVHEHSQCTEPPTDENEQSSQDGPRDAIDEFGP